jgi:hypothetical protein
MLNRADVGGAGGGNPASAANAAGAANGTGTRAAAPHTPSQPQAGDAAAHDVSANRSETNPDGAEDAPATHESRPDAPVLTVNQLQLQSVQRIATADSSQILAEGIIRTDASIGSEFRLDFYAFELAILDSNGNPVVPTIGYGRDSFFNFTEQYGLAQLGATTTHTPWASLPENVTAAGTVQVDVHAVAGCLFGLPRERCSIEVAPLFQPLQAQFHATRIVHVQQANRRAANGRQAQNPTASNFKVVGPRICSRVPVANGAT